MKSGLLIITMIATGGIVNRKSKSEFQAHLELTQMTASSATRNPPHPAVLAMKARKASQSRSRKILTVVVWLSVAVAALAVTVLVLIVR